MQTPNEKASGLGKDNVQDIHNLPNPGEKVNHFDELLVGWDSEYDTSSGFIPISTQFYVLNDDKPYYIEHVGRKPSLTELIEYLNQRYPEYNRIKLVTHFSIAEIQGLADGRELVLKENFKAMHKTLIGNLKVRINGGEIGVEIIDTYLLSMQSLKKMGDLMGLEKLNSKGYRERGDMLEWYQKDPENFKSYALRDAEIAVKFYIKFREKLKELGLQEARTIANVYGNSLAKEILRGDFRGLGYVKEKLVIKGKTRGYRLGVQQNLQSFIYSYYGGRNETYLHGLFNDADVYDYDLISAYSSIMSLIPSWDFQNPNAFTSPEKLYDFIKHEPLSVGYVNVKFKFKQNERFPGFPIKLENGLFFLKEGVTICTLQEFLVSYPYLKECTVLAYAYKTKNRESVISKFTRKIKEKRDEAKARKDDFANAIFKIIGNSGYGKFLQGLRGKTGIDLKNSTTDKVVSLPIGVSKISNPVIGAFITGCIRALVAEYLHHFSNNNMIVGNTTTDGFTILGRKLPDEELKGVGLFSKYINSRLGGELLELKHQGKGFLGIKTRGYTMIKGDNLLTAVTGISLKELKDEQQKKDFILSEFRGMQLFKDTKYPVSRPVGLREWLEGKEPGSIHELKGYNWDYDLKRKPANIETDSNGGIRFQTAPFQDIEELSLWKDSYEDFKRGIRKDGKQIGVKNKLCTPQLLKEFMKYIGLRKAQFTSIRRINDKLHLKIFTNLLYRLKGWGYKKVATTLSIPDYTVKYWIKEALVSEEDLKRGVVSELLRTIKDSQTTPPELVQEIELLWEEWVKAVKKVGFPDSSQKDVALHLLLFEDSLTGNGRSSRQYIPPIPAC